MFLISPNEFNDIFDDYRHIYADRRVAENYVETEHKILFDKYKAFYETLISGKRIIMKTDYELFDVCGGFTGDLSICEYGEKFMDKRDKQWYKSPDFTEPYIEMRPFILAFYANTLFTNIGYTGKFLPEDAAGMNIKYPVGYPENAMGIRLEYPKEIYYYKINANNVAEATKKVKCAELQNYNVYKKITDRINKISKALIFSIGEKEYKTKIKISKSIKDQIGDIYFLKTNACVIK
jgi:hypothetical protein